MTLRTILSGIIAVIASNVGAVDLGFDNESHALVGIYIKNIATGEVMAEKNADITMTPASVMKAVTTASVLSAGKGDSCFTTSVYLTGDRDNGRLNGNILVKSSADPTMESNEFRSRLGFCDSIVEAIKRRGIRKIEGRIVIDESLPGQGPLLTWEVEDIAWPYGAGLHAFNWRGNCVTVYPNTGRTWPAAPGLDIELRKVDRGSAFVRGAFSERLIVYGSSRKADWAVKVSVPNPAAVFGAELIKALNRAGIEYVEKENVPAGDTLALCKRRSPVFNEIMRSLMVRSDNLFAEGILRTLAPEQPRVNAIRREKAMWAARGVESDFLIIHDGSGLTRANRLSARFLGDMLQWMAESDYASQYASFFPRAGKEGTMRGFLAKSKLKGKIALKTGSVSGVQAYAGYKFDDDGKPSHSIVIIVNGFTCPRREVKKSAEQLLERLF